MTAGNYLQPWIVSLVLTASVSVAIGGCAAVPRRYVWIADTNITLTTLSSDPQSYVGKVVLLGGAITEEEEENEQYLLLHLKNRPLDQDYRPHRPADSGSPEAGFYWVMVPKQQLPSHYRNWGRVTLVGRVTGEQRLHKEPVLLLLYMRGWETSGNHGVWENIDPNYVPSVPIAVH